jgi:hypothetical protein
MKQTAVEWLEEFMTNGKKKSIGIISLACAKAKEMEKQQIIDAYSIGAINGEMIERDLKPKYTNPIQYYNETFKSE